MSGRASVFETVGDFDVEGFAPKSPTTNETPPPNAVRAAAEASSFRSRDPVASKKSPRKREPRRHRTGRNVQLNVKVRAETLDTFHRIADSQSWMLAQTLEEALAALERELAAGVPLAPISR